MNFKQNQILMMTFVESQFGVMSAYQFRTKASSYEDIFWVSVSSYVSLWVSSKSRFRWRHLLSLSLKLFKFRSFKQQLILIKTSLESQFEVMLVYEFQTKANSSEDVCWVSVWSYVSFWVSNKTGSFSRHLLNFSSKLYKFASFKQNLIHMKRFVGSKFEVM